MKGLNFNPDITNLYLDEFRGEIDDTRPQKFRAGDENGSVSVEHIIHPYEKFPEDEIVIEYPTDEPGVRRRLVVVRDIRSHLESPEVIFATFRESRYSSAGELRGSLTRMPTTNEIALSLIMARDLFKDGKLEEVPEPHPESL